MKIKSVKYIVVRTVMENGLDSEEFYTIDASELVLYNAETLSSIILVDQKLSKKSLRPLNSEIDNIDLKPNCIKR